jgi:hypothetical protein
MSTTGPDGKVTVSAALCSAGEYNVGSNTLPCQKCALLDANTAGRATSACAPIESGYHAVRVDVTYWAQLGWPEYF